MLIGISILVNMIGFGHMVLGSLYLLAIGLALYQYVHRWLGYMFFLLALIALVQNVFHINIAHFLFATLFIYFGYRLFTGKDIELRKGKFFYKPVHKEDGFEKILDGETYDINVSLEKDMNVYKPTFRNSLIGSLHLINSRFELDDMNITFGIGDVKIDLSKAIIPEGVSSIVISGIVGDVDIYVPYDLDVSVAAAVTAGGIEVLGYKQSGLNRQMHLESPSFKQSTRKVKISVSILIGDIDVRHL